MYAYNEQKASYYKKIENRISKFETLILFELYQGFI